MTRLNRQRGTLFSLAVADDENGRIYGWRDHAKRVLAAGLSAGGNANHLAQDIIDRLGRRGFVEFGELLGGPGNVDVER